MREHWSLDPQAVFLNHGSYGACPKPVLHYQDELRARLELAPVPFMLEQLPDLLSQARATVAKFLGAQSTNLAFVRNATEGVNTVLASFPFQPGDEMLVTSFAYPACRKAADYWCNRSGARLVELTLPFPVKDPGDIVKAVRRAVGKKTKLLMLDHITSGTGLILPLEELLQALSGFEELRILVDGAHAPGMLDLPLEEWAGLGLDYYTGNFHKWCCSPKGAGFLWVHPDREDGLHPLVISHGYGAEGPESRLWREFDWTGTDDPTPWLCAPFAIEFLAGLFPGGWAELRRAMSELLEEGVALVRQVLETESITPKAMRGLFETLLLPDSWNSQDLARVLWRDYRIDAFLQPICPGGPVVLRLSAFLYNEPGDYRALAAALRELKSR